MVSFPCTKDRNYAYFASNDIANLATNAAVPINSGFSPVISGSNITPINTTTIRVTPGTYLMIYEMFGDGNGSANPDAVGIALTLDGVIINGSIEYTGTPGAVVTRIPIWFRVIKSIITVIPQGAIGNIQVRNVTTSSVVSRTSFPNNNVTGSLTIIQLD